MLKSYFNIIGYRLNHILIVTFTNNGSITFSRKPFDRLTVEGTLFSSQHGNLPYHLIDTQYNDTQHNDTQPNDTQHNDTQPNDTQHSKTQHNF
jgi:hypothetical protein